ncbi:MAG: molybdopterin-dependent oxidoreductase, partial [bacterium]|nr:molybdopterin-dependent oxidoreductase [bacterium]
YAIESLDVVCNKPRTAAYRGPGAPQAAFAIESALDELAEKLSIDPIDLRLRCAAKQGTRTPYGPTFKRIGLIETLEAARDCSHYKAPLGPDQGRGIAVGFWFNAGLNSSAEVHLNEDGTAIVATGNPDLSGSRASLAIMAAEELGIEVHRVRPVVADTDSVGFTDLSGGSRVTFATGQAVIDACRQVVRELRQRAAKIWDCDPDQVDFVDGCCVPAKGSGLSEEPLALAEVARQAGRTGGPINGQAQLTARGAGPSFATHLCDVEVDPETGRIEVLRYTAVQDAGRAIHPGYVEGQMQGGAAQGMGWALNEELVFDTQGVLQNPGFLDYRMPVASDLPMIETVVVEVPNPNHPYGVRGVGETPIVPPLAAVANAVRRAAGVCITRLPISPPRLLAALHDESGGDS